LRQFASKNREMQGMSTTQGNLASIAKEFDNAQKKADKLKDKTGKLSSARAANASSTADDANQQWETQAPYVFEQLQSLDETRVNHLRDVLTQFQTHEVDSIEQNRKPAELCLNALLNIETADEIKKFAARVSTEPRQAPLPRRRSSASNNIRRLSLVGGSIAPPMPPPPRLTGDRIQQMPSFSNESSQGAYHTGACFRLTWKKITDNASEPKETPKKQGLKSRLGTVMGRRKNPAPPPAAGMEKMKKERNRSSLMPFRRRDSSKSRQGNEDAGLGGRPLTPAFSTETAQPTASPARNVDVDRQSSVRTQTESRQQMPMGSAVVNGTTALGNQFEATRINAPVNQTPVSNNAFAPPTQVSSVRLLQETSLLTLIATSRTQRHTTIPCSAHGCHISCSARSGSKQCVRKEHCP
jgi:F-BAR domain only protein